MMMKKSLQHIQGCELDIRAPSSVVAQARDQSNQTQKKMNSTHKDDRKDEKENDTSSQKCEELISQVAALLNSTRDPLNMFSKPELATTLAGSTQGYKDGKGRNAQFGTITSICFNPNDNCLYVCDDTGIRKVTMQGVVTTFMPSSIISSPSGIVLNCKENTFFVATNFPCKIFKITSDGQVSVFMERREKEENQFACFAGIALDQKTGNIFTSDELTHLIHLITPQGEIKQIAGPNSGFGIPMGMLFDEKDDSLLVCDNTNNHIRRVRLTGEVSILCSIENPIDIAISNQTILVTSSTGICKVINADKKEVIVKYDGRGAIDGTSDYFSCGNRLQGMAICEISHSCFFLDSFCVRRMAFSNF